mmetsp:Transcript_16232/g.31784  ORF Transcript_16232/g.31784 Transcript_16232/m.31784 type:complete len:200 (-) Transcript_16232:503-1102(-)
MEANLLEYQQQLQRCELEAKEATKREQDLMQQLFEARARILEKEREVCNLQGQLAQELTEQQDLFRKVLERDHRIHRLLETPADSNARASDAGGTYNLSKTTVESHSRSAVGSPNVASCVRRVLPRTSCNNVPPKVGGPIMPMLPQHDMMFRPQATAGGVWQTKEQLPQNNFHWKASTAPPSPIVQGRGLRQMLANRVI